MKEPEAEEQDTFNEIIQAIDAAEYETERHLSVQIDDSLREAICAAQTSNKAASVSVTIKVTPGAERRILFSAAVASKIPKPPVQGVTLYADANGEVHKSDPAQTRLEFYDSTATKKLET